MVKFSDIFFIIFFKMGKLLYSTVTGTRFIAQKSLISNVFIRFRFGLEIRKLFLIEIVGSK
jgi:hypothetical protein